MRRKYIDFVPTKKKNTAKQPIVKVPEKKVVSKPASKMVEKNIPAKKPVARPARMVQPTAPRITAKRPVSHVVEPLHEKHPEPKLPPKREPGATAKLGVIEDLNPNFVNKEVPKRPLGLSEAEKADLLREAKAKKVLANKPEDKMALKSVSAAAKANSTYKTPTTPFINQEKVVKRPLSKNVYSKQPEEKKVAEKAEPKGPVTIISKPEKDAHVSVVVTIIITIILGAAAGTVAFLLLPK